MIIHFLSGQNITVTVGEKEKVATVKKRVSEIMSTPHESISLLYNGTILEDELTLDAYNISNASLVTAVKSPQKQEIPIEEQEKQVEDYLVSLCTNLRHQPESIPPSPTGSEDHENVQMFKSIAFDTTKDTFKCKIDSLFLRLLNEDGLMRDWVSSPFFSQIIGDPSLVREIILTHPLIVKLIELNPGLQEFIEQDDNIQAVIAIITKKERPRVNRAASIRALLEAKMGHKLVFSKEHLDFIKERKMMKRVAQPTSPEAIRKLKQECIITDRQKKAIMSVIANHPELIVQFIKRTPLYTTILQKNPELYKSIFTPERLQALFSKDSLEKIMFMGKRISMEEKKKSAPEKH